jgi:PTH1 family peptidyl-tRNA hydrolase
MKLIVGLGNPGDKYFQTRHNVGFMVIDQLLKSLNVTSQYNEKLDSMIGLSSGNIFAKPDTYMNSSGVAVSKLMQEYKTPLSDLWVIHDDLDITLGKYKIQESVGPRVHGGITSIEKTVGKDFNRVRVGVDNRKENIAGEVYVLQKFTPDELLIINSVVDETIMRLKELILA